jgi:hypothetical protein
MGFKHEFMEKEGEQKFQNILEREQGTGNREQGTGNRE